MGASVGKPSNAKSPSASHLTVFLEPLIPQDSGGISHVTKRSMGIPMESLVGHAMGNLLL